MSFTNFAHTSPLTSNRLLKVSRPPIKEGRPFSTGWSSDIDVVKALSKLLKRGLEKDIISGWNLIKSLFKDVSKLEISAGFLKQFRSAQDNDKAVYQALIDSEFKVNGFHGGGLLHGDYTLSLNENDSFPLNETLGLTDGQKVKAAFWVNVDFENIVEQNYM